MNNKYKSICPHDECTGCMACINACMHHAISIQTDTLGFKYPMIDTLKCTDCGLCTRICPQNHHRHFSYPLECFAAALKSESELQTCASGGAATAFTEQILSEGGIVVGCSGQDMTNVHHIIIEDFKDIDKLKGSKYVQSHISDTLMRDIRTYLVSGRNVLFIGTGCQTAGLRSFLIKDFDNLITIDLVCHGVPSQQLLRENISLYSDIDPDTLKFRYKDPKSGKIHYALNANYRTTGKRFFKKWYKDPYLGSFLACTSLRKGCYKCLYSRPERQSDITICDFWGLGKNSRLYGQNGVSAILINTANGMNLFENTANRLTFEQRTVQEAVSGNGQLQHPSAVPLERDLFIQLYQDKGLSCAYKSASYKRMLKKRIKDRLYSCVNPRIFTIYRFVKKLIKH